MSYLEGQVGQSQEAKKKTSVSDPCKTILFGNMVMKAKRKQNKTQTAMDELK